MGLCIQITDSYTIFTDEGSVIHRMTLTNSKHHVYELLNLLPKSLMLKMFCRDGKYLSKFGVESFMESNGHDQLQYRQ